MAESVASKVTEDDICESVTSAQPQLTKEKDSEEKEDDAHETAQRPAKISFYPI